MKALYAIPVWTRVVTLIADHPGLADALGGTPSHWACYRFASKLSKERSALAACLDALAASLRSRLPGDGRRTSPSTRATSRPTRTGSGTSTTTAPSARSTATPMPRGAIAPRSRTRKGGGFYGYKIHAAVCTDDRTCRSRGALKPPATTSRSSPSTFSTPSRRAATRPRPSHGQGLRHERHLRSAPSATARP